MADVTDGGGEAGIDAASPLSIAGLVSIAASVDYRLTAKGCRRRAAALAALGSFALMAPGVLVATLVVGEAALPSGQVLAAVAVLLLLAGARAALAYRGAVRRLARFRLHLEPGLLLVHTGERAFELHPQSIENILDLPGALGGLRMRIGNTENALGVPLQIEVPRGGESFAELRRALQRLATGARWDASPRRTTARRVARVVLLVAAIFFLPFVVVDVLHRFRPLACVLAVVLLVVVRAVLRPGR